MQRLEFGNWKLENGTTTPALKQHALTSNLQPPTFNIKSFEVTYDDFTT